jgi:integrase
MESRLWANGKTITYRYHPIDGKPLNLGTDRVSAIRKVLDLLGSGDGFGTLQWVWEKYTDQADAPNRWKNLSEYSREDYRQAWKQIAKTFGKMQIGNIASTMVARYVHIERARSPKRANTEKALLSVLFGHGIKLGVCTVNATIGVEPHRLEPRSEVPSEDVMSDFLSWLQKQTPQRKVVGMAAELASLAGYRKEEFLHLTWQQVDRTAGKIETLRGKQRINKRAKIVEEVAISPALESLLVRLEEVRTGECPYVISTRDNNAYSKSGFQTLWQRCVQEALRQRVISINQKFTFHDLRAFYTTVHKKKTGSLPDLHANPQTTARVYDRNKVVRRSAN